MQTFLWDVQLELHRAQMLHPPFNSHHEAYAVLLEEVQEYWEDVKKRREAQDEAAIYDEVVQIAAVAWRIVIDLGLADTGAQGEETPHA